MIILETQFNKNFKKNLKIAAFIITTTPMQAKTGNFLKMETTIKTQPFLKTYKLELDPNYPKIQPYLKIQKIIKNH